MSEFQNPPAFPSEQHECQDGSWNQTYCDGMSLRDYLAAKCIPAFAHFGTNGHAPAEMIAAACYELADAMLIARATISVQS